jgi:hypothetical protein
MILVTVFSTFNLAEAHVVRSRLEASGFYAEVKNELAALSIEGYSMATGGIEVQVPEDQLEDARELLDTSSNEN